eukprot:gene1987-3865_t
MIGKVIVLYFFISADLITSGTRDENEIGLTGTAIENDYSSVGDFTKAHRKRLSLQDDKITIETSHQKLLVKKYLKWRNNKESNQHETIKTFCKSKISGGCSWEDANFLLKIEDQLRPFRNEVNGMSLQDKWLLPSNLLYKSLPPPGQTECTRLSKPPTAEEFYENYVSKGKPVIISNGLKKWKAVGKWNLDYLLQHVGEESVKIYTSTDGDFEKIQSVGDWKKTLEDTGRLGQSPYDDTDIDSNELLMIRPAETNFKFKDYYYLLTNYSNPEHAIYYLQKHDMRKWNHLPIIKDIEPSIHSEPKKYKNSKSSTSKSSKKKYHKGGWARFLSLNHYFIWLAKGHTRGPIHYDMYENIYSVIRGSKTFEIFHPMQTTEMYETISSYRSGHLLYEWTKEQGGKFWSLPISSTEKSFLPFSPVNITNPNYTLFPEHKKARKLTCKLNEGDILYLPSYWWHEVSGEPAENEDISIAINAFYEPFWIKASDLIHYSRNPFYVHLHKHKNDEMRSNKKKLKKMLDIDYWRK